MNAQDTVKKVEQHSESIWCPHCGEEFGIESRIENERELQAEISFRAGMQEVIDFCKVNQVPESSALYAGLVIISEDRWQAKLREWEVK